MQAANLHTGCRFKNKNKIIKHTLFAHRDGCPANLPLAPASLAGDNAVDVGELVEVEDVALVGWVKPPRGRKVFRRVVKHLQRLEGKGAVEIRLCGAVEQQDMGVK